MERTKAPGIYRSDDGATYEVDKRHKGERLRQRGFANFEEAESWLTSQMDRVNRESVVGQRIRRRFKEAAAHYIRLYEKKPSIVSDIYHLKAVMPWIGGLFLDQVYNEKLQPFIEARKAQMRKMKVGNGYELRPIKNKTVNLSLSIVRRILNLAARDWRDLNGMTWLETPPLISLLPLTDQRLPRPLMWAEQRQKLHHLPDHLAEMALFDLNCGVRDEVVCNLQWTWEVPVKQLGVSIFVVPKEHVKGVEGKKTDRVLVCNTVAQSIIERLRGKHPTHVFVYRQGEKGKYRPIGTMNNTAWQNWRCKEGLGDFHPHDLRHTVGLRLREAGVKEETVAEILWHSNKTMTGHYSMAQIVEVFEALEKIKDETNRWNVSLQSLVREAAAGTVPQNSPTQKKTG
jgi:integrase